MVSDCETGLVRSSGRWSCSVCKEGVGLYLLCFLQTLVYKRYSGIKGRLRSGQAEGVRLDHLRDYQQNL